MLEDRSTLPPAPAVTATAATSTTTACMYMYMLCLSDVSVVHLSTLRFQICKAARRSSSRRFSLNFIVTVIEPSRMSNFARTYITLNAQNLLAAVSQFVRPSISHVKFESDRTIYVSFDDICLVHYNVRANFNARDNCLSPERLKPVPMRISSLRLHRLQAASLPFGNGECPRSSRNI